jgi:hypothetical protein
MHVNAVSWFARPSEFMPSNSHQFNIMSNKRIFALDQVKTIGEQLGIRWDKFDPEQFRAGLGVDLEHVTGNHDDPLMTGKIALAHLIEFPDYCTRLAKMKADAESFWDSKKENIYEHYDQSTIKWRYYEIA